MVERLTVAQVVAGSNPVTHPLISKFVYSTNRRLESGKTGIRSRPERHWSERGRPATEEPSECEVGEEESRYPPIFLKIFDNKIVREYNFFNN